MISRQLRIALLYPSNIKLKRYQMLHTCFVDEASAAK
uniref:Uncharacterized protein n=1 Tax=Arundo donax TaxID=35708 RepID=A0A0A9FII1_ARUDO